MTQGIEDGAFARIGPENSSPSTMRYSLATRINIGFTFKKSGGGPGSSGAVSIDEQAVKPRQITSQCVECIFPKNVQSAIRTFRTYLVSGVAQPSAARQRSDKALCPRTREKCFPSSRSISTSGSRPCGPVGNALD